MGGPDRPLRSPVEPVKPRYLIHAALYMAANIVLFLAFNAAAVAAPLFVA